MPEWVNRFRKLGGNFMDPANVVSEFRCRCQPGSHNHERMVSGALRTMSAGCYLEDGVAMKDGEHEAAS